MLGCVRLFMTPWTIQSVEFSRPEYWSGLLFPSCGDLPNPGIEPRSPTLQVDSLPTKPPEVSYKCRVNSGVLYSELNILHAPADIDDMLKG